MKIMERGVEAKDNSLAESARRQDERARVVHQAFLESGLPVHPSEPEAVKQEDGRIGWPRVLEYEYTIGPLQGMRVAVPPIAPREGKPRPGYSKPETPFYFIWVYDQAGYELLRGSGRLYAPEHTGTIGERVDTNPHIKGCGALKLGQRG